VTYIWDEVQRMAREQGTSITRVLPDRYVTRRLDGGEIADPPIYVSHIAAYLALLGPIASRVTQDTAA
jgi:hypothetical protein